MTQRPLLTKSEIATVAITYFTLGITVAVVHIEIGTPPWLVIAGSVIVVSATAILSYTAVAVAGGGLVSGVLSGWLVSTRFGLLAAAVAPRLWTRRSAKAAAALVTFDPNVALALNEPAGSPTGRRVYLIASLALLPPYWIGTVVGVLIGESLGDISTYGLDTMLPALFIAIIWPRMRERKSAAIGFAAAVVAVALVQPLPAGLSTLLAATMAFGVLLGKQPSGANGGSGSGSGETEDTPSAAEPGGEEC